MDWETFILEMIAGIALFLYGMELLTDSMKLVLGDRFRVWLQRLTKTRFHGFVLGAALTIACQSSTIVTVLLVGLVSADFMSFEQSIGIILGSNLGSTITGQIISFNITKYYTAIVSVGVLITMMASKQKRTLCLMGNAIIGLGILLLGMNVMSSAAKILKTEPAFTDFVEAISNRIVAVIVGIIITVILQSSGVVSAILLSLAGQGLLSLDMGIAIMIGSNLGSCSTALLASMRQSRVAQQVAMTHTLFNVVLVVLWAPMLPLMMSFVRLLPPHVDASEGEAIKNSIEIPRQIANAHTFMNVFIVVLLFPFTKQMAWVVAKLRPVKPTTTSSQPSDIDMDQQQRDKMTELKKPSLPPLQPQYLNPAYLSLPSVQFGWHVLVKETHRLAMCFTDAFQLITQTLVHAQQHQQSMGLYQYQHDYNKYGDVKRHSILSIPPRDSSAPESPSSWESVFSHDVNLELSTRASWATQLWSYLGSIRAFHSSLVADSLTTKQTTSLLTFSMILQHLQMAIQAIHEQIITPARSQTQQYVHVEIPEKLHDHSTDPSFLELIHLVHVSWQDVAISIAQLETHDTITNTSDPRHITPAQRVIHASTEVSRLVRMTITSCGPSSNVASIARALKRVYFCGWHIAHLTMQDGGHGHVQELTGPPKNTLYNSVLKIMSLNNMIHLNRSTSRLGSIPTTATISRQPSSSVVNIHTDPSIQTDVTRQRSSTPTNIHTDPGSVVITSPAAHSSPNTPSEREVQTNEQDSSHQWSQPMFHGMAEL